MPEFQGAIKNSQIILPVIICNPEYPTKIRLCRALLDTGSTNCSISLPVLDELKIKSLGSQSVLGINGEAHSKIYKSLLFFNPEAMEGKDLNVFLHYVTPLPTVVQDTLDAIIGMDVIASSEIIIKNRKFIIKM